MYAREIKEWQTKREERLREPHGWLTLTARVVLADGKHTVGSAKDTVVPLPSRLPATIGKLEISDMAVTFTPAAKTEVRYHDKVLSGRTKFTEAITERSVLSVADVEIYVYRKGSDWIARVSDPQAVTRRDFLGCVWFDTNAEWRKQATWVPHAAQDYKVPDVSGKEQNFVSRGSVHFTHDGQKIEMLAFDDDGGGLWFIFRDASSGKESYGAGRFLFTEAPKDGKVTIDFNKAQNPPCAVSSFTTCPLAPPQNWLKIAVRAGEKAPKH